MRYALLTLLCLIALPAFALMHPDEKLRNPDLEARALSITTKLRCVTCQNESVEASGADIARDVRIIVRRQILDGKTDADIFQFLRDRYGDYILLNPPVDTRTYALWFAPFIVLALGALCLIPMFRRKKR